MPSQRRQTDQRLNAFGQERFTLRDVVLDTRIERPLKTSMSGVLAAVGLDAATRARLVRQLWQEATNASQEELEERIRAQVAAVVRPINVRRALRARAERIAGQVRPFLSGRDVLDIGCGDGMVSQLLQTPSQRFKLADVMRYVATGIRLPFRLIAEGKPLPYRKASVDTTLLLTVLHHASDPLAVLREARRVTRARAIVIESVFGVSEQCGGPQSLLHTLTSEQQRKYAGFVDWFYNRILHDSVNVPYNYLSPAEWCRRFEDTGWEVHTTQDMGIDQPVVPEHHLLFVLAPR